MSKYFYCCLAVLCSVGFGLAQTEIDPDCPAVGVVFIPHEDCSKYYVCDNGIRIILDCPAPLYYNAESENCDYPANVPECVGGTRPPAGNSTTLTPSTSTPTPPSNSTTPTPPSNSTTPTPPSNSTTPTPPSNSTTPTPPSNSTTPTPPSNSTTPTPPSNSTTPTPPSNSTTPTPPSNSTTPTPPSNSTTPTPPSNSTTPLPNGCPPTGVDKIPHPTSCSLYIICANGIAYDGECADGLHFNPIVKECDFPENVNCTDATTPTTSTTPSPIPECPPEGVSFHPYPGNCSLYVICVEGFPLIQSCVSGTCFDPEELQCRANSTEEIVNSEGDYEFSLYAISRCGEEKSQGVLLMPSYRACEEYFVCDEGFYKGTLKCQDGYNFDSSSQSCIPQTHSTCLI